VAQPVVSFRAAAIIAAMSAVRRGAVGRAGRAVFAVIVNAEKTWWTSSLAVGEECPDVRCRSAIAAAHRRRVATA
jgi:hypothetical protein